LRRRDTTTIRLGTGWLVLLGATVAGGVHGQGANRDALNVDLADCIALDSEEARYACYQERVDAAMAERDASATAQAPSPEAGRTTSPAATEAPAPRASAPTSGARRQIEQDEIFAKITGLRERGPDIWIITLDNGQVWQMNRAKRYPLRVGLDVRLNSTRWGGSYRLTAPEHGSFVQVERVF